MGYKNKLGVALEWNAQLRLWAFNFEPSKNIKSIREKISLSKIEHVDMSEKFIRRRVAKCWRIYEKSNNYSNMRKLMNNNFSAYVVL